MDCFSVLARAVHPAFHRPAVIAMVASIGIFGVLMFVSGVRGILKSRA